MAKLTINEPPARKRRRPMLSGSPPEVAVAGFLVARCAGKDKYFSVLDAIYQGQQAMYASGQPTTTSTPTRRCRTRMPWPRRKQGGRRHHRASLALR